MSSTASALTALGASRWSTSTDAASARTPPTRTTCRVAKLFTAGWGVLAVVFAASASLIDNLIQAVNILGSLFYGTILGVFLVAFFVRRVGGTAMFVAALISEVIVFGVWLTTKIGFLWFNVIGCAAAIALALFIELFARRPNAHQPISRN